MSDAPKAQEQRQSAKRRNNESGASSNIESSRDKQQPGDGLVPFLERMLGGKEEQMKNMQRTIDTLNERLGKMQETSDRMERQQPNAEQENV